ncbi:MAG: MBL fold metallo-hydrolase [Parvularculaceae bacterium]|nr:MBL fold metallo-hydrolase [Parvularculaceae bacterium]
MTEFDEKARMRAVILGCGSSGGVPRVGGEDGRGDWGTCDPGEPKNRRLRCSLLIERADAVSGFERSAVTSAIIDTSPDFREQMLAARVAHVDGVVLTHDHADQTHGIDDLRAFAIRKRKRVPVWLDRATAGAVVDRFRYCFEQAEGSWYPAILKELTIPPFGEAFSVSGPAGDIPFTPFLQRHGPVNSLGFRIGDLAYSSDVNGLPDDSFDILAGVKIWIVDALQIAPHGTHANLETTLRWIEAVKPERAILTNLHVTMDYATLVKSLPRGVEPAHDGLSVEFSAQA